MIVSDSQDQVSLAIVDIVNKSHPSRFGLDRKREVSVMSLVGFQNTLSAVGVNN